MGIASVLLFLGATASLAFEGDALRNGRAIADTETWISSKAQPGDNINGQEASAATSMSDISGTGPMSMALDSAELALRKPSSLSSCQDIVSGTDGMSEHRLSIGGVFTSRPADESSGWKYLNYYVRL